jgi:Sporulation and spore germination
VLTAVLMRRVRLLAGLAVVLLSMACTGSTATRGMLSTPAAVSGADVASASGGPVPTPPPTARETPAAGVDAAAAAPVLTVQATPAVDAAPRSSRPAARPAGSAESGARPAAPQAATPERREGTGSTVAGPPRDPSGPDRTNTRLVTLYWIAGDSLRPAQRRIPNTERIGAATLEELLRGPLPGDGDGLSTALPTPREVLAYVGRDASWGSRVALRRLDIVGGIATADFSRELRAYGGGSTRSALIRQQVTRTLEQFPTIHDVRIAIEGDIAGALQP